MTYKLTHDSVAKVVTYLEQMAKSDDTLVWSVPYNVTPERIAYLLRQGMRAAVALGYSQYSNLIEKFVVKARPGKLVAEKRIQITEEVFKQSMSRMVLADISSLAELIGAILKHKQDEMYFPNVRLESEELYSLYKWLNSTESVKGYMIVVNDQGTTITRDESIGGIAWKPTERKLPS